MFPTYAIFCVSYRMTNNIYCIIYFLVRFENVNKLTLKHRRRSKIGWCAEYHKILHDHSSCIYLVRPYPFGDTITSFTYETFKTFHWKTIQVLLHSCDQSLSKTVVTVSHIHLHWYRFMLFCIIKSFCARTVNFWRSLTAFNNA